MWLLLFLPFFFYFFLVYLEIMNNDPDFGNGIILVSRAM